MKTTYHKMFTARDKREFATEKECVEHEKMLDRKMLVGLTDDEVEKAFARENVALAGAIERNGDEMRKLRLAAGESKHPRQPERGPRRVAAQ